MAAPGNANDKRVSLLRDIVEVRSLMKRDVSCTSKKQYGAQQNLKNDKVVWEPVVKAAEKYQAALKRT